MANKRLGKGLEALIPQIAEDQSEVAGGQLAEVETAKVRANPHQPRTEFDRKGLDELKSSILENGVIQPITVRRVDSGFEVIAGERRLRAVQELGYPHIPAYVMDVTSDDQMLELALVENIQREDLNPIELAKAYQQLQKEYGLTQEAVAKKVGKDRATVANCIRLLKLPEVIQNSLQKDEINMGHARALMGLPSPGVQIQVWRKVVKQGWNVRQVEDHVRKSAESGKKGKGKEAVRSPYLIELEDRLRGILSTQVRVRFSGGGKGKIEIAYFSDEDLERLLEMFYRMKG